MISSTRCHRGCCCPMKTLRRIVAFPVELLQLFVAIVLIGGLRLVERLLRRIDRFIELHVYYMLSRTKRWLLGEPMWKPIDYRHLGVAPRTDAEREMWKQYVATELQHLPQCSIHGAGVEKVQGRRAARQRVRRVPGVLVTEGRERELSAALGQVVPGARRSWVTGARGNDDCALLRTLGEHLQLDRLIVDYVDNLRRSAVVRWRTIIGA